MPPGDPWPDVDWDGSWPSTRLGPPETAPAAPPPAPDPAAPPGLGGSLLAGLLGAVDAVSSNILQHPVRPRARLSPAGLLRGEIDVVRVEVPAVMAAGLVLDRVVVRAERARIVPGLPPRLRTGEVRLDAVVSQHNVDRWTRASRLPLRLALREDGVVVSTGLAGIRVGEVVTELDVAGAFLRLRPRRATVVGLPAPLVRFLRGYLPLPPLPKGSRLRSVRHGDGELTARFELPGLDEPLSPDVSSRLRSLVQLPGL